VTVAARDSSETFDEAVVTECKPGDFGAVGSECRTCPEGSACDEANLPAPVSLPGFYTGAAKDGSAEQLECQLRGFASCPIVLPCEPVAACPGANQCEQGYQGYRCSECATGYFKLSGECNTCPECSKCIVVMYIVALSALCVIGWYLSRKRINLGILSVGVDYLQVLTILTMSNKVKWPQQLKNFFNALSFFNLNLDLLAPECSYEGFKYQTKWSLIMSLPMMFMAVFLAIYFGKYFHKRFIQGRTQKLHSHAHMLIGSGIGVFYYMYLYITKTAFDIFNCSPTDPPDGKKYLEVVFEECFLPGGTHMQLLPAAVFFFMLYSLGLPAVIAKVLLNHADMCYEDQVLLAKGTGSSRSSNPNCYEFRKRYRKLYEKFKPEKSYWMLVILFRKFWIACAGLLFRKTPVFLLAFSLMVIFVSYAAQAQHRPYMCIGEIPSILAQAEAKANGMDVLDLHMSNMASGGRGMQSKKGGGRQRSASVADRAGDSAKAAAKELWNYNNVEQVLLFTMCLVLINAIMFQSPQIVVGSKMELGLAAWTFVLIAGSLVYFLAVLTSEITLGLGCLGSAKAEKWFGIKQHAAHGVKDDDEKDDEKDDDNAVVFQSAASVRNPASAGFGFNQKATSMDSAAELAAASNPAAVKKMKADLAEAQALTSRLMDEVKQLKKDKSLGFAHSGSAKALHGGHSHSGGLKKTHSGSTRSFKKDKAEKKPAAAETTLPPGWTEHFDEASGLPYFLDTTTGKDTWQRPEPAATAPSDAVHVAADDEEELSQTI